MSDCFNIYMTGVGGQGIGLLSQSLLTAIDLAGIKAIAVDTHGLAQRGGVVVSRIRCGANVHSPLIMKGCANLILALEVHEAMRALIHHFPHHRDPSSKSPRPDMISPPSDHENSKGDSHGKKMKITAFPSPALLFLDVVWQPLPVRLGEANVITAESVKSFCHKYHIKQHRVISDEIQDPRMQNMALLGTLAAQKLVPNVETPHYRKAIETLFKGDALHKNMELFDQYAAT